MTAEPAIAPPTREQTVEKVLVPLDGLPEAEDAIRTGVAIAERLAVPLSLFCWHWGIGAEWVGRRYLEGVQRRRQLDCELAPSWTDDEGAAGPLLAEAHRVPGTLVCMASHARSGIGALLNGSTTEDLLRQGEPVLLVGPEAVRNQLDLDRPVLVTVDGSSLSETAIPIGAAWARRLDVPLELVVCLEPTADAHPWRGDVLEASYVERLAKAAGSTMWETLHGPSPAHAIAEYAAGHASMIVTSTHGRSGLGRVVAGSVAVRVVSHAPCPVLVLRPDETRDGWQ